MDQLREAGSRELAGMRTAVARFRVAARHDGADGVFLEESRIGRREVQIRQRAHPMGSSARNRNAGFPGADILSGNGPACLHPVRMLSAR